MGKSWFKRLFLCLALVLTCVGSLVATSASIFAQDETTTPTATATPTPEPTPTLELQTKYPVLTGESGKSFSYSVDIKYSGVDRKTFNISVTPPQGWSATTTAGYPESQVSAIQISGSGYDYAASETIKVNLSPNIGNSPDPGDYIVTLDVSSGSLTQSLELKATVTAKYALSLTTDSGKVSTDATAGKENHFALKLQNTGTAAIDDINFTSTKPDGWIINFKPEKVETLGAGQTQQIDVVITPPSGKTVAGDYMITISASNGTISASDMEVRVTASTPSIWGYVGIIIVVLVIAGLAVLFMRLGRR